jgi:ACS family sodium-dependent inorganic phosphate cotransporter
LKFFNSDKYGGKWPLGFGLLITALFALITPWAARTHTYLLIFVRVVQGLGEVKRNLYEHTPIAFYKTPSDFLQGLTTPAMHEILAYWAPPDERSQLCSIVYAGKFS